jgi:hypothetical protein
LQKPRPSRTTHPVKTWQSRRCIAWESSRLSHVYPLLSHRVGTSHPPILGPSPHEPIIQHPNARPLNHTSSHDRASSLIALDTLTPLMNENTMRQPFNPPRSTSTTRLHLRPGRVRPKKMNAIFDDKRARASQYEDN